MGDAGMMRRIAILGALLALPLLQAAPAAAVEAGKSFGDWQTECEAAPDGPPRCFLSQTQFIVDEKTKAKSRLIKLALGYFGPNGQGVMVVVLPLGVDLRAGAALRVDDGTPMALTFQQCLQDGCVANMALDDKTVAALKKSKKAQIDLKPYNGAQAMAITVSTKGITDGIAYLKP